MKIAVVGAGAIGSVVGALLSKSGEDVTLVARKAHAELINSKGLILNGPSGEMIIQVRATEKLGFKPDLTLLTVKSQDVESSLREIAPLISGAPIVTMQNGVQSDDIAASVLGRGNVISSVVVFASSFLEPGKVSYSTPFGDTTLLIGEPFGPNGGRLPTLLAMFNRALPTEMSSNIRGAHWTKLLWNLNTAVPAVVGLTYKESARNPRIRKLYIDLMKEGLRVVRQAGITPAYVPGFPLTPIRRMGETPQPISSFFAKRFFDKLAIYGSMYQSIKRGQRTEVAYLNGEIVGLGKKFGVSTPANTLIVELVHQIETAGKFLTIEELIQRLN